MNLILTYEEAQGQEIVKKKVKIDTEKDTCLYTSPQNPPNTGTKYTRGTDLFCHIARSGIQWFYFHAWSLWQGEEEEYKLCYEETAKEFLIEKAGLSSSGALTKRQKELAEKYFPDIFEEDA